MDLFDSRPQHEQVTLLLQQLRYTSIINALLVTLAGIVLLNYFDHVIVSLWMVAGYLISVLREPWLRYLQRVNQRNSQTAVYHIIALMMLSGAVWGLGGWLFLDNTDGKGFIFFALLFNGIAASLIGVLSTIPIVWICFATTVLLPTVTKLFVIGHWQTGLLGVLYLFGLAVISIQLGRRIQHSITLDLKNEELLHHVTLAKEEAEAANLAKSQFMAAASHDLRQPLHAQSILLEALRPYLAEPEPLSLYEKLTHANNALHDLFNSLLEISQLDAGSVKANVSHQTLTSIISPLIGEFDAVAAEKQLTLINRCDNHTVMTDPVLLTRVLRNLISNAIKFTHQGSVTISTRLTGDALCIEVKDTGMGISDEDKTKVFDEYVQLKRADRNREEGIGLGLSVVERLCKLLNHAIELESIVDQGTTFKLTLPLGDPQSVTAINADNTTESFQRRQILLIDDETNILDAMEALLSQWGCITQCCENLAQAEKLINEEHYRPDLIISDYRLRHGEQGTSVVQTLQSILPDPPQAILITGDTDPQLLKTLHELDFYVLHKPIKPAQLKKVLNILLPAHEGAVA